jgi:hypothetical protein
MTWNYRVVRKKHCWHDSRINQERVSYAYGIHEAFYDEDHHAGAITENPVEPFGDTIEELRHAWLMMAEAFGQPILDYDKIPEPGYDREHDPLGTYAGKTPESPSNREQSDEDEGEPFERNTMTPEEWDAYDAEQEGERCQQEELHAQTFVGTPTLKDLITKIYDDYAAWRENEEQENIREHDKE